MDGKTHLAIGVLAGAGMVYLEGKTGLYVDELNNVLLICGCALGSLLPDIDINTSMLGRFIPGWIFWKHRTVTHSFFFMIIIGAIGAILELNIALTLGVILGIATHLILDSLTPRGLPYLLFPFFYTKASKKRL